MRVNLAKNTPKNMKLPRPMRQKLPAVMVAGLGGFFTVVDVACAQPWAATTTPNVPWKALAASADGTRLVAAASAGGYYGIPPAPIYVSTDAGATWIQTRAPSNYWSAVACSADAVKWVAVTAPSWNGGDGLIYTSPDLGTTWMRTSAPSNNWSSVASSADGVKLVAVATPQWAWDINGNGNYVGDGAIYRSLDSGGTWMRTSAPSNNWSSVASSADGTRLVAVVGAPSWDWWNVDGIGTGAIYSSLDSGATWIRTSAPSNSWSAVASSADGAKLVAVAVPHWYGGEYVGDGAIYSSLDSGVTWIRTSAPSNIWFAVASSADGAKLVAATDQTIYASSDSGATWRPTGAPLGEWSALASSADGYRVVAGGYYVPWLCTLPYSGPWRLADAPGTNWESVASSADGVKLVAVASSHDSATGAGPIYTSSDSGATWSPTSAPSKIWSAVASSADGTQWVAAAHDPTTAINSLIYTSGDSGVTWTETSALRGWVVSFASSADGTRLLAVAELSWDGSFVGDSKIYNSLDSGSTWLQTSVPSNIWSAVASSADGAKWVAVASAHGSAAGTGRIYTSSDSGANWTRTSAPSNNWSAVASASDGVKLVAVATTGGNFNNEGGDGLIYTSTNSGASWTPTTAPTQYWTAVASSADGTRLMAVGGGWRYAWGGGWVPGESIYLSTDSGATWTPAGGPRGNWTALACSADGSNIVAVGDRPGICTLRSPAPAPPLPPSPQLTVSWSGATLGLSWLVPSTRFVLQQNSDLGSTNWVEVPAPPTLDYTNLHYRLTLTPSLGGSYYRLKQQ